MDLKKYLFDKRTLIEKNLKNFTENPKGLAAEVMKAMNYSLFAGGKRLRPILCLAGVEAVGGDEYDALQVACALELIHTYSLVHDDLPVMDNDDMRRGKPTNHKIFGEAVALLAGDGLLTEAFHMMTMTDISRRIDAKLLVRVIRLIASSIGYKGMVGGQTVDIQMEGEKVEGSVLEFIHTRKTGDLICASVTSGAILGNGSKQRVASIQSYGKSIGLAFQIADDILDIEGDCEVMGKGVGGDEEKGKITYPALYGVPKSKEILEDTINSALKSLNEFDSKADPLRHIARYIIERKK